jgi:hypothetical protein
LLVIITGYAVVYKEFDIAIGRLARHPFETARQAFSLANRTRLLA